MMQASSPRVPIFTPKALHDSLNDSLSALAFHASPPPSLTARFPIDGERPKPKVKIEEENRRSPPEVDADPEGAISSFIENLLSSDHAETQPHLMAIGYELEALVSIYSASAVRLSVSSRPPSWNSDEQSLPPSLPPNSKAEDRPPTSVPMYGGREKGSRDSQAWLDALNDYNAGLSPMERIRYEVNIPAWEAGEKLDGVEDELVPEEPPVMRVLVSLPPTYPNSSPPQLQLLGRYLGSFPIDTGLFGNITRTYISSSGVPFTPGDVCVFEGLTHVQSLARAWYAANLSEGIAGERAREAERERNHTKPFLGPDPVEEPPMSSLTVRPSPSRANFSYSKKGGEEEDVPTTVANAEKNLPAGFKIVSSEPLVEKKSTFVGHAVRVTDEREVPLVIHELLSDRKIAKAAHPAIFAYRIAKEVGGAAGKVYNSDYDDDGETQAGARLKHLLEILELENVLVVVSRWFGGTLLGPDRFKLINQAARDALELGGFLDTDKERDGKESGGKGKAGKKR